MRLLSLSFSLFALASSAPVKTPSFSLISDRSANGTPIIAVTFPNGHSDTLVLTQFVDGDGSQKPATIPEIPEPRDGGIFFPTEDPEIPESRDCRYIGHLRSEPEACLAMTGCIGSEDVDFTILSAHATESPLFKWTKEGRVEIIESPFKVTSRNIQIIFILYSHKFS